MTRYKSCVYVACIFVLIFSVNITSALTKYNKKDLEGLREEVRQMFQHAYNSYLKYAYPYDELRPLSCDGVDTWGSYSLTLIDALDTLAVMGNYTEFQRVVGIITTHANFDANINVSVFETNIRIIGGLLSAHLLSYRAGVAVEPGWPCNGPLLQLAEDVARRLLAAFDTATGMPYGTVNLRHGVPEGETSITCTAGVGTFILELGTLSRLTGDPLFEEVAMNALYALYHHRSAIGLVGNHIDVQTGRWTAQDAGIGAGVDSYYEYLAKGAILLQRPELMHMFHEGRAAIDKYLKRDDWHLWVSMSKGQVTLPVFQSLEAYWPGVLSLIGDINKGIKSLHNYHQVWKQYGFTPEFYNIPQGEVGANREGYPLRPELVESVMYLYRATGDPYLLEVGKDILRSIQHSARTSCGYATIKDVRDHRKEDRMESFFLAETTKYLFLLFDPDNFIHNRGQHGTVVKTPWGECVLEAGGYIFNTEAHPIDPGALHCCSGHRQSDIQQMLKQKNSGAFRGDPLSTHRNQHHSPPSPYSEESSTDHITSEIEENNMDYEEIIAESDTDQPEKRRAFLNKLVTELGGAIDVIKLSNQNMEDDKDQNNVNKGVPNVSYLDKTSDLHLKLNLLTDEVERIKRQSKGIDDVKDEGDDRNVTIVNGSKLDPNIAHNDEKTQKMGTNDALEYRADDSDRVYSVTDKDDIDLDVKKTLADSDLPDESTKDGGGLEETKEEERNVGSSWTSEQQSAATDHMGLSSFVSKFLLSESSSVKITFDPQQLLERLRTEARYKRNMSWEQNYELLSCPAQPFLQRLAMSGEVFGAS